MVAVMTEKHYDKVASMLAMGVPHEQIALATGQQVAEVAEIAESPELQVMVQEKALEQHTKYETLNDGWDIIENLSMNGVISHLQMNPDPDFALKAAVMANKAQRRGQFNQNNVIPGQAGVRAVINLNANFVTQLQQNFKITQSEPMSLAKKDSNFLAPKAVAEMLKAPEDKALPVEFDTVEDLDAIEGYDKNG